MHNDFTIATHPANINVILSSFLHSETSPLRLPPRCLSRKRFLPPECSVFPLCRCAASAAASAVRWGVTATRKEAGKENAVSVNRCLTRGFLPCFRFGFLCRGVWREGVSLRRAFRSQPMRTRDTLPQRENQVVIGWWRWRVEVMEGWGRGEGG